MSLSQDIRAVVSSIEALSKDRSNRPQNQQQLSSSEVKSIQEATKYFIDGREGKHILDDEAEALWRAFSTAWVTCAASNASHVFQTSSA